MYFTRFTFLWIEERGKNFEKSLFLSYALISIMKNLKEKTQRSHDWAVEFFKKAN